MFNCALTQHNRGWIIIIILQILIPVNIAHLFQFFFQISVYNKLHKMPYYTMNTFTLSVSHLWSYSPGIWVCQCPNYCSATLPSCSAVASRTALETHAEWTQIIAEKFSLIRQCQHGMSKYITSPVLMKVTDYGPRFHFFLSQWLPCCQDGTVDDELTSTVKT